MKPYTLVSFFIFFLSTVGLAQVKEPVRISRSLEAAISEKRQQEPIVVIASVREISELGKDSVTIMGAYAPSRTVVFQCSIKKLQDLIRKGTIIFADLSRIPKDELTTGALDISLNKISLSHASFPSVTGDSILVSVKEQKFDTADIDIRGRYRETGQASAVSSSHASIMATIVAGAGNSTPLARGPAWGAYLTSSSYATLLPDGDAVYQQNKISIQNHSYGTGIENYYGPDAVAYDMTVNNTPVLLHVFSSGNSGTTASASGPYSGIQGFANITGSFKMAKNIITAGATDSINQVAAASSKGPAYDGRLKPDLVAFGEDGSSGAAALVSGTAALVQQVYKNNHGNLPSSALIRAVLLNSADDAGEAHVDFSSGFGSLNAWQAVKTISENRFRENSVTQNETRSFTITIPAGIRQLKCLLAWTDPPAAANAAKALVNDLDATLVFPLTGESWKPWVLNHFPNRDSILQPAKRKVDTLNNVEQITIEMPQEGSYTIQVKGSRIQAGSSQAFALAYQLDTMKQFKWTYPVSGTALTGAGTTMIRWQTNIDDTATLEYSLDGIQWQSLASGVSLKNSYYRWQTPDTVASALLRMRIVNTPDHVSDSFTISRPVQLGVGFNCADSFLLFWNSQPVNQYQLYHLGAKYLQPILVTPDTLIVMQKATFPSLYYAVAPLVNGKPGYRSNTLNYTTQAVTCYIRNFLVSRQNNTAFLTTLLGTVFNISSVSFQKITPAGIQVVQTIPHPGSVSLQVSDPTLTRGLNRYRLQITLADGSQIFSSTEDIYYFPDLPVIVYPNPARQNQPIHIIAEEAGNYSVTVFDANGRKLYEQLLEDISQQIPPLRLSAGIYFIRISSGDGKPAVQKLVVLN